MASLYRLDVMVRGNSTIAQDDAIRWTKSWVNKRQESKDNIDQNGNYINEYYADLFDSRTAKSWKVFSDVATKNRQVKNTYISKDKSVVTGVIFTSPYIIGGSFEIVVSSSDGIQHIDYTNKNAKIFLTVEDSLKAIARVENQDNSGFDIVLYDGEYFEEDKKRLDCSDNPIKVNVLITQ